jgi:murein L,D-transpeptidase YcbB/YkuD
LQKTLRHRFLKPIFIPWIILIVTGSGNCFWVNHLIAETSQGQLQQVLQNRIAHAKTFSVPILEKEPIKDLHLIETFYKHQSYLPVWVAMKKPSERFTTLLKCIRQADREALDPQDYHLAAIEKLAAAVARRHPNRKPDRLRNLADLELLSTDAFFTYASHLLSGRINPERVDPEWSATVKQVDFIRLMQTTLESNKIESVFNSLLPGHPGYVKLRNSLIRYRKIVDDGGWPKIPEGPNLHLGHSGKRVRILRARLRFENEFVKGSIFNRNKFDHHLDQAVRLFQQQHGLEVDGIVGPQTLRTLNIPTADRVRQIELNMERWRWLPRYLGNTYVIVNIADFKLEFHDQNQPVVVIRAVVGQNYRRTPVFSTQITHLVLNPSWSVPKIIALEDMLPQIQMDIDYLNRQRLRVFQDLNGEATEIDPATVDWKTITPDNFNYRFQQAPGSTNALGRVKFMFPNKFDVYIHDTPSQHLFAKTIRNFSSGCIRIEKPIDFAHYLMQENPRWTRENIIAAIDSGVSQTLRLPSPIPLHFIYWTAWVDGDGTLQFREDIYGRDRTLEKALHIKYGE